eukprot:gene17836-23448_t
MSPHLRGANVINNIIEVIKLGLKEPFCLQALHCLDDSSSRVKLNVNKKHQSITIGGMGSPTKANNRPTSLWPSNHVGIMFSAMNHEHNNNNNSNLQQPQNYDNEIILALQTLSSSELYPKQIRDKFSSNSSNKSSNKDTNIDRNNSDELNIIIVEDQNLRLLEVIKIGVVKYLNDSNRNIRLAAALTCTSVIDNIILNVDFNSVMFDIIEIIDRLLLLGVGDDDYEIRSKVFTSMQPSFDLVLSQCNNINCLIEGLQDEFIDVRAAAMTLLCRIAHFDTIRIMPLVRLHLKNLIRHLYILDDKSLKLESVILLQAMVRGSNMLIAPYVTQILQPLMTLINDQSPTVVSVSLSTIAELAFASPDSVKGYLDDLLFRLIRALNDTSSNIQRDIAVAAIGKLVPALTMVTEEPYTKYPGLFDGLVRAIRNDDESYSTLRYEAIKTVGLLGIVDSNVYDIHLSKFRQTDSTNDDNEETVEMENLENPEVDIVTVDKTVVDNTTNSNIIIPKAKLMQNYYFKVVIKQLISIIMDSSLGSTTDLALQGYVLTALSAILCQIGNGFIPYIVPIRRKLPNIPNKDGNKLLQLEEFESLINRLLKQRPLPTVPQSIDDISIDFSDKFRSQSHYYANYQSIELNVQPLNIQSLESQLPVGVKIDYVDWIKRLSLQIIRHSPSPIIRACIPLAKLYRPLTEALFNSAFYCIWEEICSTGDSFEDIPFIHGIELLLENQNTPHNIICSLLNLVRFMDMQDKRLPLDVKLLAKRSNDSNMYAKCLRYREIEFYSKNLSPSIECIEDLIVVSNELGLRDRAMGVLQNVISDYSQLIDIQPVWLEKLNLWEEAKEIYQTHITNWNSNNSNSNPCENKDWMTDELGLLRCSSALSELDVALTHANKLKDQLKNMDTLLVNKLSSNATSSWMLEIQRIGGHAAWMLGKWDNLENYVELPINDTNVTTSKSFSVRLDRNVDFYKTILSIHKQDYSYAMSIISETRNKLSNEISSLLSESYPRAYRAMVSMQILSELEEIIEYKESVANINSSSMPVDIESNHIVSFNSSNSLAGTESNHMSPNKRNSWNNNEDAANWNSINSSGSNITRDILRAKKQNLLKKWRSRLKWAPKEISVFRQILSVHTLVAEPLEDLDSWLELVTLCRKEGMFTLCENVLKRLGAPILPRSLTTTTDSKSNQPVNEIVNDILKTTNTIDILTSDDNVALDRTSEKVYSSSVPIPLGQRPSNMTTSRVLFSTMKYWWSSGERQKALNELNVFIKSLPKFDIQTNITNKSNMNVNPFLNTTPNNNFNIRGNYHDSSNISNNNDIKLFRMKCLLKRAEWMRALSDDSVDDVMNTLREAIELVPDHYPVWHAWAVFNYDQLQEVDAEKGNRRDSVNNSTKFLNLKNRTKYKQEGSKFGITRVRRASSLDGVSLNPLELPATNISISTTLSGNKRTKARKKSITVTGGALSIANLLTTVKQEDKITGFVIEAIKGFVRSIILGQGQPSSNILQDILRLITLWFSYGSKDGVSEIIETELDQLSPENWLSVLPQLIARMHVKTPEISKALRKLLSKVAAIHPQALVCPISVALNTTDEQQKTVASEILNEMSIRRSQLVEEARMLSSELMHVAITPQELWFDGIEKACTAYLEGNIPQMMKILLTLHFAMDTEDNNNEIIPTNLFENWLKVTNSPSTNSIVNHVPQLPPLESKSAKNNKNNNLEVLIDSPMLKIGY